MLPSQGTHAGISLGRASQSSDGSGDENNSNIEYSTSMEDASTLVGSTDDLLPISRETTAVDQRHIAPTVAAAPPGPRTRHYHYVDVSLLRTQLSVPEQRLITSIRNLNLREPRWSEVHKLARTISNFQRALLGVDLRFHQLENRDSNNLTDFERAILGLIDREMKSPSQNNRINPTYLVTPLQLAFLDVVKNWLREHTPRPGFLDRLFNRRPDRDGRSGIGEASGSSSPGQSRRLRR